MEISSFASFIPYWENVHGRTSRVVRCIPPQHLEWSYRPGKFTLGDLVRHLATIERYMFAETVCGRPSRYPGAGRELADGHAAVLEFYDRLHAESVALLSALPDSRLEERCETPGGGSLRVWKWLRSMLEHEIHHRGQIYLYLSLLEVPTPPLYGLTAEEVQERSVPALR